jgi:outer membrane protein
MRLFIISLLTLLLSGCSLLQPTNPYAPVSGRLAPAATGFSQAHMGIRTELGDEPFTLTRCIAIALENNPEVAATSWESAASDYRVDQARAQQWPTLSSDGAYNRYLDPQRLIQASFNGELGYFDTDITRNDLIVKLPLFTGGRIINEIAAAELLSKAEGNRLARTREELVFNVSSTFYAILGERKVILSLEFSLQAMEEQLKKVGLLLEAQKAAKVDYLRTEVRVADLRQSLVKEQNLLAIQKRVLASLLGLDYDLDRFAVEGKLAFEAQHPQADPLVLKALQNRPDYLAAKNRLEAQAKRVDIARAGHLPTVALVGAYGVRADSYSDSGDVGTIGVGVTIPLYEGGRVVAKVNEERALLGASQERLRKLELQVRQEVETAVLDIRSNSERVRALDKAIEQARESLRIEQQKYELTAGSITDVLDAQTALLLSETNYFRALADFRTAVARLDFATGVEIP